MSTDQTPPAAVGDEPFPQLMPGISSPPPLIDSRFGASLRSIKSDLVRTTDVGVEIAQCGAARLDLDHRPPWPSMAADVAGGQPIIETYVCSPDAVAATSDNEPFVTAWLRLVEWMNATVRHQLAGVDVELADDAYITASVTPTSMLEGTPHMDDDIYEPNASAQMVAIIAELAGPRIATSPLAHAPLRPMGQVTFSELQVADLAAGTIDHHQCEADQLVVFIQFGQLHAGPPAKQVAHLAPTRQLVVMRAPIQARLTPKD